MHHISERQFSINLESDPNPQKFRKVLVIGLGQIGLPVAKYIQDRGFETCGCDANPDAMEIATSYGIKQVQNFSDIDVFVICISTHRQDDIHSPDVRGIFDIAGKISNEAKNKSLEIIGIYREYYT